MREQTGPQQKSPIAGKHQNCNNFGTYLPVLSNEPEKAMCHGGVFDGDYYRPCPVRDECRSAFVNSVQTEPERPRMNPQEPLSLRPAPTLRAPELRAPDFSRYATQLPRAKEAPRAAPSTPSSWADYRTTQAPRTNHTRTQEESGWAEPSPFYPPEKNESVFERLFFNILQGMISAIGWHIWRFCQTIDLFGMRG